jgi:hypothetical protein
MSGVALNAALAGQRGRSAADAERATVASLEQPQMSAPDVTPSREAGHDAIADAPAVLRMVWADPEHTAEHLALWTLRRFGPRAESSVARLRARRPEPGRDELERLVVERQTRVATTEGAFVGGPFIVLIPVAFCASLLAQGQMVFELAAVAGRDPNNELRAAELLLLLGAYPTTEEAGAALAKVPRDTGSREGPRLPAGRRIDAVRRLAYLIELLGPADQKRSVFRETIGWIGIGFLFLIGLALPLVWVPYMAFSMHRSTARMAVRARRYYSPTDAGQPVVVASDAGFIAGGGLIAFARMALMVVFPILVAVVGLLTGFSFAGGRWLTSAVLLLAVSALATLCWLGYRRWQLRKGR